MIDVFVGGVQGFDTFASATVTATLRATGRVGLYAHANAVQQVYDNGDLPSIVSAFSGDGSGFAELPFETNASGWFSSYYTQVDVDSNLTPSIAAVDVSSYTVDYSSWSAYVQAAAAVGISRVTPIFSPNDLADPLGDFATLPAYASLRAAALLGGGITLDSPPSYSLARGSAYLSTIESEIRWANANGITSTVIVSPTSADFDSSFRETTAQFIAQLAANNALPDDWVVETYATDGTTVIGSEADPESIAGVALWIAQNADTQGSIQHSAASLTWTTPVHVEVGGASTLSVNDTDGQAYVFGGSGGLSLNSSGALDQASTTSGSVNTVTVGASAVVNSLGKDTISTGANATVTVGGSAGVTTGANSTITVQGVATINGGGGSNTYTVSGTASVLSQATGSDLINALAGSNVSATVTGANFTLADYGATVRVSEAGNGSALSLSGGGALIYGGAGQTMTVQTNTGVATQVTLGSGNATVDSMGNDAVVGGSGSNLYLFSGNSSLTSQSSGQDVINALAGSTLNASITSKSFELADFGAAVHVSETGGGDNSSVTLAGGGALVGGGAGQGITVSTNAGVATQVTLGTGNSTVISWGNDTIQDSTGSHTIQVNGNATVTCQTTGSDCVRTMAGSNATVAVTSPSFKLFNKGGTVNISETGGGDNAFVGLNGGSATVTGGAGNGLTTTTSASTASKVTVGAEASLVRSNGQDTVFGGSGQLTFIGGSEASSVVGGTGGLIIEAGSGNLTVTGGSAADIFHAGTGTNLFTEGAGNDVSYLGAGNSTVIGGSGTNIYDFVTGSGSRSIDVQNFHVGRDTANFGGNAISSQTVVNGSLKVVLSDGALVTFDGVTKTM